MFHKISHLTNVNSKLPLEKYLKQKKTPIYLVLDDIRSLHNVGAMFRTSDAARIARIYLTGYTGQPPRSQISKTALKTVEFVPWEYRENALELLREMKLAKIKTYALEICENSSVYNQTQYSFPLALFLGNEIEGVKDEILAEIDQAIHIPMLGMANSLNVATAYGISVFTCLEQYQNLNLKNK